MKPYDIPFLARGDMVKILIEGSGLVAIVRALHPFASLKSLDGRQQLFEILRVFSGRN